MKELSAAELDALITEATVDAYTEDEELTGFAGSRPIAAGLDRGRRA